MLCCYMYFEYDSKLSQIAQSNSTILIFLFLNFFSLFINSVQHNAKPNPANYLSFLTHFSSQLCVWIGYPVSIDPQTPQKLRNAFSPINLEPFCLRKLEENQTTKLRSFPMYILEMDFFWPCHNFDLFYLYKYFRSHQAIPFELFVF